MSSPVLVCFVIQGDEDDPETGVQSSFRVDRPTPPRALTLSRLKEMFPFEGTFHFRLRVPDESGLSNYYWVDLTAAGDDVLELARNLGGLEGGGDGNGGRHERMDLKILPIDFGEPAEEEAPAGVAMGGGVFGGDGVGVDRGGCGPGVGPTEDEYLAGGVSGLDLGGGERFDVETERGSRAARETPPSAAAEAADRAFDRDGDLDPHHHHDEDDDDDDDDDGRGGHHHYHHHQQQKQQQRFETEGGGSRSFGGGGGGGGLGEYGERGRREEKSRGGGGDDGDRDDYRRYRAGAGGGYGGDEEDADADWKASVNQGVKDLQKKTSQVAKTMGFGAKKMWNAINKGVGAGVLPSEEALENLHELGTFLGTPFSATNQEHLKDLGNVWGCLFPDDEFEGAESPRWKEAGFQEANVAGDFRGTGVLALKGMVFFCQNYERKALALCRAQSEGNPSNYPWAVVANNLTLMLADVLELRANQFAGSRKGYWGVFDRRGAYFEASLCCCVFCMAFRLLDHTWAERGATRSKFGQIIGHTKSVIEQLLEVNPPTLPAFMGQAEEMGMLR
ncbi:unnamed protein product [Pylaiella littoralis]